jgi:hypothetical protein
VDRIFYPIDICRGRTVVGVRLLSRVLSVIGDFDLKISNVFVEILLSFVIIILAMGRSIDCRHMHVAASHLCFHVLLGFDRLMNIGAKRLELLTLRAVSIYVIPISMVNFRVFFNIA